MAIEIGKTYDNSLDFEVSYLSDKPIHPSHSFWGKKNRQTQIERYQSCMIWAKLRDGLSTVNLEENQSLPGKVYGLKGTQEILSFGETASY
jgi:hypothetical protein